MQGGIILLLALVPVVVASALSDLRHLKIRNLQVLAAVGVFVVLAPVFLDLQELPARLLAAGVGFAICFVLFALRVIGGGDAKMLPAVLLFVPPVELVLFLRLFAVALAVVSVGALVVQRSPAFRRIGWSSITEQRHVPVGVAIAASVLLLALIMLARG